MQKLRDKNGGSKRNSAQASLWQFEKLKRKRLGPLYQCFLMARSAGLRKSSLERRKDRKSKYIGKKQKTDLPRPRKRSFRTNGSNIWQRMFEDERGMTRESSLVLVEARCSSIFECFCGADGDVDEAASQFFCFVRL